MQYRAIVSRGCCKQIFDNLRVKLTAEEQADCPVINRQRNEMHSGVIKQLIRMSNRERAACTGNDQNNVDNTPVSYNPKGPIWHHGPIGDKFTEPCNVCKKVLSKDQINCNQDLFEKAKREIENNLP